MKLITETSWEISPINEEKGKNLYIVGKTKLFFWFILIKPRIYV